MITQEPVLLCPMQRLCTITFHHRVAEKPLPIILRDPNNSSADLNNLPYSSTLHRLLLFQTQSQNTRYLSIFHCQSWNTFILKPTV